jgi:Na+/alanine symporter
MTSEVALAAVAFTLEIVGMLAALTVTDRPVLEVSEPEMPLMVRLYVAAGVVVLVVRIRELELVVGFGLNEAVIPLGRPDMDRVTLPENPL